MQANSSNARTADAEFKMLDDMVAKGGADTVAAGRDVFRMALPAVGTPLEIMQDVEQNTAIEAIAPNLA